MLFHRRFGTIACFQKYVLMRAEQTTARRPGESRPRRRQVQASAWIIDATADTARSARGHKGAFVCGRRFSMASMMLTTRPRSLSRPSPITHVSRSTTALPLCCAHISIRPSTAANDRTFTVSHGWQSGLRYARNNEWLTRQRPASDNKRRDKQGNKIACSPPEQD